MDNLVIEVTQEKNLLEKVNHRFTVLKGLYGSPNGLTKWGVTYFLHRRVKNRIHLKAEYESICRELKVGRQSEMSRTPAEDKFLSHFKKQWRIQLYPQVWVGNICLDWFTPALAEGRRSDLGRKRFKGLAIEIDGSIHNREQKMKIDSYKEECLTKVGIGLWRYSNEQVFKSHGLPSKMQVDTQYVRQCSRERERLWSRIYLLTLIYHAGAEVLDWHFPGFTNAGGR